MMYTIEQIDEAYNKLPKNLSIAIALNKTETKMAEIGKKFDIHIDKIGELDAEINYVLIGLAKSDDFYETMKTILGVSDEKAKEIFKDINEKVFTAIRTRYQEKEKIETEAKEAREMADKDTERREEIAESGIEVSPAKVEQTQSNLSMAEERLMRPFRMTRAETDYSLKTVSAGGTGTTVNGQTPAERPSDSRPAPADEIQRHSRIASDPYLAKIDEEDLKKK